MLLLHRYQLKDTDEVVEMKATDVLAKEPFLSLVALVAILDPPREEAIAAVKIAHKAGISVKMITGASIARGVECGKLLLCAWQMGLLCYAPLLTTYAA